MATLKTSVSLSSTDLTTGTLSSSTVKDITVTKGGILVKEIDGTAHTDAVVLLTASEHDEGTKVYIKNTHASNVVYVKFTAGTTSELHIPAGGWAFFGWKAAVDMKIWPSADNTFVEYGTFK